MKKTLLINALLLSILSSCSGGGGRNKDTSPPEPKVPVFTVELVKSSFFSTDGNITITSQEVSNVADIKIYSDSTCETHFRDVVLADLASGIALNLQVILEETIYYYASITTAEGDVVCDPLFSYKYDVTPPSDPTQLGDLSGLTGTSSSDGMNIMGDPSSLGITSGYIVLYADAGKTVELGRMTVEEYENGYSFTPPIGYQNQTFDVYLAVADEAGNVSGTFATPISITHDNIGPIDPVLSGGTTALAGTTVFSTATSLDFTVNDADVVRVLVYVGSDDPIIITSIPGGGNIVQAITLSEYGATLIRVVTEDALGNTNETISFTMNHTSALPTISATADQSVNMNSSSDTLVVTINDSDSTLTCAGSLSVSSSNTALVDTSDITISGTAPTCNVDITPKSDQKGTSVLTLTVTDTYSNVTDSLNLTVTSPMITMFSMGNPSYGDGDLELILPLPQQDFNSVLFNYNFVVDWGDGSTSTVTSYNDPDATHTYGSAGDYTVTINGTVESWSFTFGSSSGRQKLRSVSNMGDMGWTNLTTAFNNCNNLESFVTGNSDTSGVVYMNSVFAGTASLVTLDLSTFDTSSVTTMAELFNSSNVASIDLSNFDTSLVTDMNSMFRGNTSLTSVDVSSFDTTNVLNIANMFRDVTNITSIDLSSFVTTNVSNMFGVFRNATNLATLDISNFNTSAATNMGQMFYEAISLTSLDLAHFNTTLVGDMSYMFANTESLAFLDISNFDTSGVSTMNSMFRHTHILTSLDLSHFDVSGVTNMSFMFADTNSLTSLNVTDWDISGGPSNFNTFNNSNVGLAVICNQGGSPASGTFFGLSCN